MDLFWPLLKAHGGLPEVVLDLLKKRRRGLIAELPEEGPPPGVGEEDLLLCPGQPDIEEAPFFLNRGRGTSIGYIGQ